MADNARLILDELLAELEERRKRVLLGGGEERIQRQHQQGKLTARERIDYLLDEGSFVELMPFAEHLETGLMEGLEAPADGVVTGYGTIGGRLVFVFSQDFTVLGGSLGKVHGRKIASLMDLAAKVGAHAESFGPLTGAATLAARFIRLAILRPCTLPREHPQTVKYLLNTKTRLTPLEP